MSKKVVVFTHGFMGCSRQFEEIIPELENLEADKKICVLEGHEKKDFQEFLDSNAQTWQKGFDDLINELRKDYDEIYLVGHSMGGLISVRHAISNPDKIKGIVAIGFPIKIRLTSKWIINNLKSCRPYSPDEDPFITAMRKLGGVRMRKPTDYFKTMPNTMEFMRIRKDTESILDKLDIPFTVVNMTQDEIVSPKAKAVVKEKQPKARYVELSKSGHFMFMPDEVKVMAEEIRKMVKA